MDVTIAQILDFIIWLLPYLLCFGVGIVVGVIITCAVFVDAFR